MNKFRKLTVTALLIVSALAAGSASAKVNEYEGQHRNAANGPAQLEKVTVVFLNNGQGEDEPADDNQPASFSWGATQMGSGKVSMQDFHFVM